MELNSQGGLESLTVVSFESRRAREIAELIRRHGGEPIVAPSMREVPLDENRVPLEFFKELEAGAIDAVVLLTGVGTQTMVAAAEAYYRRERIVSLLSSVPLIARGPKPVAVLREWNLRIDHRAPEPNTWRELVQMLDAEQVPLAGRTIAVQEYGTPSPELCSALEQRGATVVRVPVYRWTVPEDISPLEDAVRRTVAGEFDVLMFTSAFQLTSVLTIAERLGVRNEWLSAAQRCLIASIGPTASEALRDEGLQPDLEPSHPKMGHLVKETCERAGALLAAKRAAV